MNKRIIVLVLLAANILLLGWWFLWGKARYATPPVVPKLDADLIWKQNYRAGDLNARVIMNVIGEDGNPIPDATASFIFVMLTAKPVMAAQVSGKTDTAGRFVALGYTIDQFDFNLGKSGYYMSRPSVTVFSDPKDTCSGPRTVTNTTMLRKIGKPVPVYARAFRDLTIPEIQKPCGFDLEAGDWIAPYGKGKIADFIVTAQREYEDRDKFNVSAVISFSNPLDGIQEVKLPDEWRFCEFKWPRTAPETGYHPTLLVRFGTEPGKGFFSTASENQAHFFRVRTIERDGQIVSALYGKIKGGIKLDGRETKTCTMAFTCYLNPTSLDRNMEFDLKRNLFTNLPNLEQPRLP
jgi:hypothetical protein